MAECVIRLYRRGDGRDQGRLSRDAVEGRFLLSSFVVCVVRGAYYCYLFITLASALLLYVERVRESEQSGVRERRMSMKV